VCARRLSQLVGVSYVTRTGVMLYVIGLGLCDEKDITIRLGSASRPQDLLNIKPGNGPVWLHALRGLEAVKRCKAIYLEAYTSLLLVPTEKLVSKIAKFESWQSQH